MTTLAWRDVVGVSLLAGIGFTVSLLIGELAFGHGTATGDDVKIGVLVGSVIAGVLASAVLLSRNAAYRRINDSKLRTRTMTVCPIYTSLDRTDAGPVRKLA